VYKVTILNAIVSWGMAGPLKYADLWVA